MKMITASKIFLLFATIPSQAYSFQSARGCRGGSTCPPSPNVLKMSSSAMTEQGVYSPSSVKSPADIYAGAVKLGTMKAKASVGKIFRLGLISGAHIGFGAYLALSVGGALPGLQASNPGLAKLIYGAVFPLGIMMTTITGGELFTGNTALVTSAWMEGQIKFKELLKSWSVSYVANFIGSIIFAALVLKAGTLSASTLPLTIASTKVALPFSVAFTRSVLCNWLVCMAVYMSSGCLSMTGKMVAMWFPICAFVTMGLEHSVANMFFIPLGMMSGADISISQFLLKNILPVTLGNIVGAILCVMAPFGTSFGNWLKKDSFE